MPENLSVTEIGDRRFDAEVKPLIDAYNGFIKEHPAVASKLTEERWSEIVQSIINNHDLRMLARRMADPKTSRVAAQEASEALYKALTVEIEAYK